MTYIKISLLIMAFNGLSTPFLMADDQQNAVIIVNKNSTMGSISIDDLQEIYMGNKKLLNGIKIQPCMLNIKSKLSKEFIEDIIKMSPSKFKKYWLKRIFSGYGVGPTSLRSVEEVIKFVSQHEGGIGFIPEQMKASLGECKILRIDLKDDF